MGNDTQALTLSDFLLARISTDEDNAGECGGAAACHVPDAIIDQRLAECEAKRRIVDRWGGDEMPDDPTLKMLAAIYAGHPDYREEWKL